MDYLDYLADYTYAELPPAIRQSVTQADYERERDLVTALADLQQQDAPGPATREAFKVATSGAPSESGSGLTRAQLPQQSQIAGRGRKTIPWPWVAAAGWLLFLLAGSAYLSRPTKLEPSTHSAVGPVVVTDTVTFVRLDTLRIPVTQYVTKIVRDTVYQPSKREPIYLTVRDTIYSDSPANRRRPVTGSENMLGREELLRLMISAE